MAIASMVIGIIGLVLAISPCTYYIGWIPGVLALIFGIIALVQEKKKEPEEQKKGKAITGIVTGSLAIVVAVLWIVIVIVFISANPDYMETYYNFSSLKNIIQQLV